MRRDTELAGCVSHRSAMIATGCGGDTTRTHVSKQQIGEGAPGLERSCVLQVLELERDLFCGDVEVVWVNADRGVRLMCPWMTR